MNPCPHEPAPDEPDTCLIPDRRGRKHRVARKGRHCLCCGWHVTRIEPLERKDTG